MEVILRAFPQLYTLKIITIIFWLQGLLTYEKQSYKADSLWIQLIFANTSDFEERKQKFFIFSKTFQNRWGEPCSSFPLNPIENVQASGHSADIHFREVFPPFPAFIDRIWQPIKGLMVHFFEQYPLTRCLIFAWLSSFFIHCVPMNQ